MADSLIESRKVSNHTNLCGVASVISAVNIHFVCNWLFFDEHLFIPTMYLANIYIRNFEYQRKFEVSIDNGC